uniref:TEA domain-containing protein n=1 Tax=Meloidogyne javanica TaxID=6303 RepID=A0A915M8Q8_MELJA
MDNSIPLNSSPLSTSSNGNAAEMRSSNDGDAEGIYPPCGRRKIILSDEGKMYGRNELIARYIKLRCGKSRTRKQVSSHIQVLARKKQREEHSRIKTQRDNTLPETNANSSSASTTSSVSNNHTTASVSATILPSSNNRDQIASVQAQVARAASAISQQSWPSLIVTNNNNNQHLMAGAQLYMAASSNPCSSVVASIPAAFVSNGNCQLNTNSSSSEQIIFTTTPSSAFTCATTINTKMTTIASPNLVLNGFTAYIEEQNLIKNRERREEMMEEESNIGQQRIELVHIPKNSETPFERISLELIQSKYPPILQELFKRGPSDAFFLAKCWANMNFEINDEQNALFAVDSYYESNFGRFDIIVSTKVCSFGNEVVEKVEIYSPIEEDEDIKPPPLWHFRLEKSPMCEYMVRFISELKKLQEPSLMNSVLENFTILQIVSNKQSEETLMVVAFIFEVREDGEDEIYTNIYRLTE